MFGVVQAGVLAGVLACLAAGFLQVVLGLCCCQLAAVCGIWLVPLGGCRGTSGAYDPESTGWHQWGVLTVECAAQPSSVCRMRLSLVLKNFSNAGRLSQAAGAAAAAGEGHVTAADFAAAMHRVGPSIVRGAAVEVAPVAWDQIGGYAKVKQRLQQAVEWPLQHAGEQAILQGKAVVSWGVAVAGCWVEEHQDSKHVPLLPSVQQGI